MANLKTWAKALRMPFFTATLVPILLGSVLAWHQTQQFHWGLFFITLFAGIFLHAGTNLSNDYFDHKSGNDEANTTPTMFSGGSRVIQKNEIPANQILMAALLFFAAGLALGLYLNFLLPGNTILWIGIAGILLGFFYTAKPFRLGYNGLGELAVAIGFGPLTVMAAYFVQAQTFTLQSFLVSLPVGILIGLVLFINEFPDYEADKKVKKNTWVVLLGKQKAAKAYLLGVAAVYVIIALGILLNWFTGFALAVFATIPLAVKALQTLIAHFDRIEELLPANQTTIMLHLITGLLLTLSFLADGLP